MTELILTPKNYSALDAVPAEDDFFCGVAVFEEDSFFDSELLDLLGDEADEELLFLDGDAVFDGEAVALLGADVFELPDELFVSFEVPDLLGVVVALEPD